MMRLLGVLGVAACGAATPAAPAPVAHDDAFSQQVILVTVTEGLENDFVADTYKLGTIPGVVNVRVAKPVEFSAGHKSPDWWIGDYHYAIFIEFEREAVTDAYGEHPVHKAWGDKWGVKELPTFRAMRAVGPVR